LLVTNETLKPFGFYSEGITRESLIAAGQIPPMVYADGSWQQPHPSMT
jgi:hypothetical protein